MTESQTTKTCDSCESIENTDEETKTDGDLTTGTDAMKMLPVSKKSNSAVSESGEDLTVNLKKVRQQPPEEDARSTLPAVTLPTGTETANMPVPPAATPETAQTSEPPNSSVSSAQQNFENFGRNITNLTGQTGLRNGVKDTTGTHKSVQANTPRNVTIISNKISSGTANKPKLKSLLSPGLCSRLLSERSLLRPQIFAQYTPTLRLSTGKTAYSRSLADMAIFSDELQRPFAVKLQIIVNSPHFNTIHWSSDGLTVIVHQADFIHEIKAKWRSFLMVKTFTNFLYHMQAYGFVKCRTSPYLNCGIRKTWQFYHPEFYREQKQFTDSFMPLDLVMSIPMARALDENEQRKYVLSAVTNGHPFCITKIKPGTKSQESIDEQLSKEKFGNDRSKPLTYFHTNVDNCVKVKVLKTGIQVNYSALNNPFNDPTMETPGTLSDLRVPFEFSPEKKIIENPRRKRQLRQQFDPIPNKFGRSSMEQDCGLHLCNVSPEPILTRSCAAQCWRGSFTRSTICRPRTPYKHVPFRFRSPLVQPYQPVFLNNSVSKMHSMRIHSANQAAQKYGRTEDPQVHSSEMVLGEEMEVCAFEDVTTCDSENQPTIKKRSANKATNKKLSSNLAAEKKPSSKNSEKNSKGKSKKQTAAVTKRIPEKVRKQKGKEKLAKPMVSLLKNSHLPIKKRYLHTIDSDQNSTANRSSGWISIAPRVNVRVNQDNTMHPTSQSKLQEDPVRLKINTRLRKRAFGALDIGNTHITTSPVAHLESQKLQTQEENVPTTQQAPNFRLGIFEKYSPATCSASHTDPNGSVSHTYSATGDFRDARSIYSAHLTESCLRIEKEIPQQGQTNPDLRPEESSTMFPDVWSGIDDNRQDQACGNAETDKRCGILRKLTDEDVASAVNALMLFSTNSNNMSKSCESSTQTDRKTSPTQVTDSVIVQKCLDHLDAVFAKMLKNEEEDFE